MKNFIHIMGINRSGGSLLARLLEGNEKVVSYPMEVGFKFKDNLFGFVDKITGSPIYIPDFSPNIDILDYFDVKKKIHPTYKWGKEKSEALGIRKNYLEKAFYEKNIANKENALLDMKDELSDLVLSFRKKVGDVLPDNLLENKDDNQD